MARKKKQLSEQVRAAAHSAFGQQTDMACLFRIGREMEGRNEVALADDPEWRARIIDLFTEDIPEGVNRKITNWWDDIPREFRVCDYPEPLCGNDGKAPSYYEETHKRDITFLDVFRERFDNMSDWERKRFIRKHYDPGSSHSLREGVMPRSEPAQDFLIEELDRLHLKHNPHERFVRRTKATFATLLVAGLGIMSWYLYDRHGKDALSTDTASASTIVAEAQTVPEHPVEIATSITPSEFPTPDTSGLPPGIIDTTPYLAGVDINAPVDCESELTVERAPHLYNVMHACTGQTYDDVSKIYTRSKRHAREIIEYNVGKSAGFNPASNWCPDGQYIHIPPKTACLLLYGRQQKNFRRHSGRR
ncbi:hypothetical protein KY359_02440 [Candidatus Woesearchaeota archaeon]|nr:hypothetical protein [Candidatus Woesearchaeota archaeon]